LKSITESQAVILLTKDVLVILADTILKIFDVLSISMPAHLF